MNTSNIFERDLEKNAANHVPLSPLTFLRKAATVFPEHTSVIYGERRFSWSETYTRCRRLASALSKRGVSKGSTVAALLHNVPAMCELHYGPAMLGAVLCTLNTRLDAEAIAFMLDHGEASVLFIDPEFAVLVKRALAMCKAKPLVIEVADTASGFAATADAKMEYEAFLAQGDAQFSYVLPADEWDAIALNYTSGTTGNPKGVVYHHRGAYLNAIGNIVDWQLPRHPVYLWTLPMFHCNGWCFPWTLAAAVGTNVCLRKVDAKVIFDLIRAHKVSHYCGAPIVHSTLINAPAEWKQGIQHQVKALVAAAAPPGAMIEGMATMGFDLTHVYGLTEVYGPATVCAKHTAWSDLPLDEQVRLNARQGVAYVLQEDMAVMNPETMQPVPADGETMGEIMYRGNIVMKGYLKNATATRESFAGGWYHTGDLAVTYPDGYVKIKDRSKDVIISGGENISSIEVEDALTRHAAVMFAAVVAEPDDKWGERPVAFVELKEGSAVSEEELLVFARERLAKFKVPKRIVFGPLPKTSTGKIQKFLLRERAKSASAIDT